MAQVQARSVRGRSASVVDRLVAASCEHSAEFPDVLANHLPMILVALARLGASDERLGDYFVKYRDRNGLVPLEPTAGDIDRERWTEGLGERSREAVYRAFFVREVMRLGTRDALEIYLPTLAPGIAGSALHPLMRLAYALLRSDPVEVGTALGYWAACYLRLPPATGARPLTDDPGEVLARIGDMPGLRALPTFDHLWYGIRATAADPDFAPVVDWLRIDGDTLRRVAETSLALYAATRDFSALHAVTGTHWVRLVSGVCPDPLILRSFWQAVAALVPSIGFPALPTPEAVDAWRHLPCPEWPAIKAAAVASPDEHDISLVFSASEEEKVYGDRLYRVVAARRMGLIA